MALRPPAAPEAAALNAPMHPQQIGKYPVERHLGSGATSEVYLCSDPFAKRSVAVKLVSTALFNDPERGKLYRKLFVTEASLAGKLQHPHICQIYDAVADESVHYIVMEYVNGGTLERLHEMVEEQRDRAAGSAGVKRHAGRDFHVGGEAIAGDRLEEFLLHVAVPGFRFDGHLETVSGAFTDKRLLQRDAVMQIQRQMTNTRAEMMQEKPQRQH